MAFTNGVNFNFDGIDSSQFGLINVVIQSSGSLPFSENFISSRTIQETTIRGSNKPYFASVQRAPLVFNLNFAFTDSYDDNTVKAVAKWLDVDYYKPFFTSDNPDRIIYCMPQGDTILNHTGANDGYITIQMRCDSPYIYSPYETSQVYDYSSNSVNGTTLQFTNYGKMNLYPEIWITKVGAGNISIVNNTNNGEVFSFTGLADAEQVYVDNENEFIQSSLEPSTYRYDAFNNNYLELVYGVNELVVYGNFQMQLRHQFKSLQGADIFVD